MLDSVTSVALTSALDGLTTRQSAIADNIANADTPGYTAKEVSFESALAASVNAGSGAVTPTTTSSTATAGSNGNNVDLSDESVNEIKTTLAYQFTSQAISQQFAGVRAAMQTNS